MKLSKRDIGLLVILLGIIAFLVCYLAIYNPTVAKNEALNTEISRLKPERDELKKKEARKPEFEEGIEEARTLIQNVREGFPMAIRPEDFIMYTAGLENMIGIFTGDIVFSEPALLESFETITAPDGEEEFEAANAYKAVAGIQAVMTYDHMKEIVKHVYERSTKTTLDSISINYHAETGVLHGTVVVGKYFMTGESDPYIETHVPPMPIGVPNPFRSLDEIPDLNTIDGIEAEEDDEE